MAHSPHGPKTISTSISEKLVSCSCCSRLGRDKDKDTPILWIGVIVTHLRLSIVYADAVHELRRSGDAFVVLTKRIRDQSGFIRLGLGPEMR